MPDKTNPKELIWIIGASEGIGAALARYWAKQGARLILSARSDARLNMLVSELGSEHLALPLDILDPNQIKVAADKLAHFGPLDRVIHLAAQYDPGKIADIDLKTAAQIVSVNLTGCLHIAQLTPPMLRKDGQLALCGSVAGYMGLPQGQIYSATKAGVINLAESLRVELQGKVDVRLISPGFVDTRLTQRNAFSMPALMQPDDAAKAIYRGLNGGQFEIHFPRRLTLALKLLRALPYWASLRLTRRLVQ
ncbi:MAG: SDR family NAD(P)-dependent oxidoreductase [Cognatishimia sp.]|uniref:SDR family NAD(P)-dependent oxidoreductase n=1 Tax=Cognatishimia sp. TaxID=2211648 RepID=UPI003B8AA33B